MSLYAISELTDSDQIRTFLMQDEDYAAYALGDLETPYAGSATWIGAARTGEVEGLALVYTALEPTALFLMGSLESIGALLLHGVGPDDVLAIAPPEAQHLLDCYYHVEHPTQMDRMRVTRQTFTPVPDDEGSPLRQPLGTGSTQDMLNLILQAAKQDSRDLRDVAFTPEMVEGGHYFGIYQDGSLIAMGGTHLIAPGARLAAVGNVVVLPSQRGRRLGTRVSQAVTESLLDEDFDQIVLNVAHDNAPAVRTYERLGFRRMCGFVEGPAHRR